MLPMKTCSVLRFPLLIRLVWTKVSAILLAGAINELREKTRNQIKNAQCLLFIKAQVATSSKPVAIDLCNFSRVVLINSSTSRSSSSFKVTVIAIAQ